MRILNLLAVVSISVALSGCSSMNSEQPANTQTQNIKKVTRPIHKTKKNPLSVSFFKSTKPINVPYKILGKETISTFNPAGIKRQTAILHDKMRTLAANMGGDAVVNIRHDDKTISGTVIEYQLHKLKYDES